MRFTSPRSIQTQPAFSDRTLPRPLRDRVADRHLLALPLLRGRERRARNHHHVLGKIHRSPKQQLAFRTLSLAPSPLPFQAVPRQSGQSHRRLPTPLPLARKPPLPSPESINSPPSPTRSLSPSPSALLLACRRVDRSRVVFKVSPTPAPSSSST